MKVYFFGSPHRPKRVRPVLQATGPAATLSLVTWFFKRRVVLQLGIEGPVEAVQPLEGRCEDTY